MTAFSCKISLHCFSFSIFQENTSKLTTRSKLNQSRTPKGKTKTRKCSSIAPSHDSDLTMKPEADEKLKSSVKAENFANLHAQILTFQKASAGEFVFQLFCWWCILLEKFSSWNILRVEKLIRLELLKLQKTFRCIRVPLQYQVSKLSWKSGKYSTLIFFQSEKSQEMWKIPQIKEKSGILIGWKRKYVIFCPLMKQCADFV